MCDLFLQSLYVVLPALLDCNPFGGDTSEPCRRAAGSCVCTVCVMPEAVRRVVSVFQTTADLLQQYQVHAEIQSQMFAYLFFFTNTSLFNLFIDKGAGIALHLKDLFPVLFVREPIYTNIYTFDLVQGAGQGSNQMCLICYFLILCLSNCVLHIDLHSHKHTLLRLRP